MYRKYYKTQVSLVLVVLLGRFGCVAKAELRLEGIFLALNWEFLLVKN